MARGFSRGLFMATMTYGGGRRSSVPERHTHDTIDPARLLPGQRTKGLHDGVVSPTPDPSPVRLAIAGEPLP